MEYSYIEKCSIDLSDNYTLLYSFICREILDAFGLEGERAIREGTRRYGRDRGEFSRQLHLSMGVKINMKSLFTVAHDLPPDPRFRRETQELNPEERVSHTLVCPMANIWKEYGEQQIGRIYCEEFHPACYGRYAFDFTRVNLSKTLTQESDEYCAFNVVLRAQNLPDELKPVCFAEYDPGYVMPELPTHNADGKRGFEILSIKLYYYLLQTACEYFGESGASAVEMGLRMMANDAINRAKETARTYNLPFDEKIMHDTYPLSLETRGNSLWDGYTDYRALERFETHFASLVRAEMVRV